MSKPYRVQILVPEKVYDRYRSRIKQRGYPYFGNGSVVGKVSEVILEYAIDNISDASLDRILRDVTK